MKPQLVLASRNKKKLKELSGMLSEIGLEVLPLPEDAPEPVENMNSFEENALIKARSAAEFTGMAAIADDSGLCVDALSGQPGVCSARFGSKEYFNYAEKHGLKIKGTPIENAGDKERLAFLLENMADVPENERTARFVCAAAVVTPGGGTITVRGECEGIISFGPKGGGGFGYDPVFWIPEFDCTFAELSPEMKNKISHRGEAMRMLKKALCQLGIGKC